MDVGFITEYNIKVPSYILWFYQPVIYMYNICINLSGRNIGPKVSLLFCLDPNDPILPQLGTLGKDTII